MRVPKGSWRLELGFRGLGLGLQGTTRLHRFVVAGSSSSMTAKRLHTAACRARDVPDVLCLPSLQVRVEGLGQKDLIRN